MLKNYLVLAFRNLFKRKLYSFINITGLATGVAVCLIILNYVDFELGYDNFHKDSANVYRTVAAYYSGNEMRGKSPLSGYAQGPALLADIPEVKAYVRTHPMYGGAVVSNETAEGGPVRFREEQGIQFVDSTFLRVFTHPVLMGDAQHPLDRPNSVVITRTIADKYFGKNADPIGKTLKVSGGWSDGDYAVTAVIADVPGNTHFDFDFLFTISTLLQNGQYKEDNGWGWNNFITYVQLHPGTDPKAVEKKLPQFIDKYQGDDLRQSNGRIEQTLQPLRDIHLNPGLTNESSPTVASGTIYFFLVIAIFILAIAWVNYINLSTARAMERAREVGIKKAVGAFRIQLISQFIFESVLVNLISVALAVLIAIALLPVMANIVDKELAFDFADPRLWIVLGGLFVAGSLISGAYPAFVLSSFQTAAVLKGSVEKPGKFSLRKALVVFQFVSSLVLIAGTFAIYRQLTYMQGQQKGFTMDQMLIVKGPSVLDREAREERLTTFKNELKRIPAVQAVATSGAIPGGGYNWGTSMRREGANAEENKNGSVVFVDPEFIETYGIELLAGKTWNPDVASEMKAVLINEASVTAFGLGTAEKALQEHLLLGGDTVAILGVLKNYHWNSLKEDFSPFLLGARKVQGANFSIHLNAANLNESIAKVEQLYKETFPGNPFDYYFLDDFFNRQYKDDQQFGKIFSLFAILAIVIACLGLWGLAAFTTTQKLREISIRKVLGASTPSIMSLLSGQFMKLVLIASIIAIPLTWYGIDTWLDNFAFRIGIAWDLFVIPALILAVIALATVSIQILRGARSNPAQVLRSE